MALSSDHSLEQARLLVEAGAYAEAAALLEDALARDPGNPELEHPLAYCYFWADEPERALELAGRLLDEHGGDEQMLLLVVQAHQAAGRPELALRVLDHALEAGHAAPAFYAERARILYGKQDYAQALAEARQALALLDAPPDEDADEEHEEGDEDEAEAFWREHLRPSLGMEGLAPEADPAPAEAGREGKYAQGIRWMALAVLVNALLELRRYAEALPEAERMAGHFPQDETAMALLGRAELANGRRRQARAAFSRALQLDPTDTGAQAGLLETIARANPLYRTMMRLEGWMRRHNLTGMRVWFINYLLFRLLLGLTRGGTLPRPVGYGLIGLMLLGMIGTWYVAPLTQTTLLADPFGLYMLVRRGKAVGLLAPLLVVAGLALAALGLVRMAGGQGTHVLWLGAGLVLVGIPVCHALLHGLGRGAWWRTALAAGLRYGVDGPGFVRGGASAVHSTDLAARAGLCPAGAVYVAGAGGESAGMVGEEN